MGRRTEEYKGATIKLRISEEMLEEIEARGSVSEVVRGFIREGLAEGKEKKEEGLSEREYKELEEMCKERGLSVGRFMEYIIRLFKEGKIYIEGLTVKTRGDCDVKELEDVCYRLNIEPQLMIEKLVRSLMRG